MWERRSQSRMILSCLIHSFLLFLPLLVVWKAHNLTPLFCPLLGYLVPPSSVLLCPFCQQSTTTGETNSAEHTLKGSVDAIQKGQGKTLRQRLNKSYYLCFLLLLTTRCFFPPELVRPYLCSALVNRCCPSPDQQQIQSIHNVHSSG